MFRTNEICNYVALLSNSVCGDTFLSFKYEFHSLLMLFLAIPLSPAPVDPCIPSPCGSNAVCKEFNGAGSCTCLPNYIGNPYEGCRPECILNSDCPANLACINTKCRDPCPGSCGRNALCQVINHLPVCNCYPGYTGNAFLYCSPMEIGAIYCEIEYTLSHDIFIIKEYNNLKNILCKIFRRRQCRQ